MVQQSKKINVAFCLDLNSSWLGGLNYYRNLLTAATLANENEKQFEFIIFYGKKSQVESLRKIDSLRFIKSSVLDRFSISWFLNKISFKLFRRHLVLEYVLSKNNVSILSHSNYFFRHIKTLAWIPDFQHKHLPHLFSKKENVIRDRIFNLMATLNDAIVFSSKNALNDFLDFYKPVKQQSHFVLKFVPIFDNKKIPDQDVLKKFDIRQRFFYIPNQFWVHKNHIFLLEAFSLIKNQTDSLLIFSGNMDDYRFPDYKNQILETIKKYGLEDKVKLLGIIEYNDVVQLILNSIAVVNPSLFEGWSSTVEEAKALDKRIILSDIPVHLEQAPFRGYYYNKNSKEELAALLLEVSNLNEDKKLGHFENYKESVSNFGESYLKLIKNILKI